MDTPHHEPRPLYPDSPVYRIHRELHARTAEPVTAPCRVRHSAYLLPDEAETTRAQVRRGFQEVLNQLEIPEQAIHWTERSGRAETKLTHGASLRIVWELHTQFYSYTTYHLHEPHGVAEEEEPVPPFQFPWMPNLGTKLADTDMIVLPGDALTPPLRQFLGDGPLYGGLVLEGAGRAWTTFQINERGQGRYVLRSGSLPPGRLGRLIRRLVEIEDYYHLVLVPQDEYRENVVILSEIEHRIAARSADITRDLADQARDSQSEHRWLMHLTTDLAELMQLTERMRHKLSAANAYYAIIRERLRWLREQTGEGYQSMEEFLLARIGPAIRSYRNFAERTDVLSTQITSLGNMMRTRVSLTMEGQSLQTMEAMKKRVELQVMMQRTVEGLSIIVLTYYSTSLTRLALEAGEHAVPLPGGALIWAAATIPLWAGGAWLLTRRVHRLIKREVEE